MMNRTSLIVFSKNRPMQCDLMLKSIKCMAGDYSKIDIYVLYDASNLEYKEAYEICEKENTGANFISQELFYLDLKSLTENLLSDFYFFCTDDTIFIREFLIRDIEEVFDNNIDLLNFSLRLGKNTYYCYPLLSQQKIPDFKEDGNILYWDWRGAHHDFGYPLEVSSSIMRSYDIDRFIESWTFSNPNKMEWFMDTSKHSLASRYTSACYPLSVAFSAPMNKVEISNTNRASNRSTYSIENLLEKYNNGYRINPYKFYIQ